MPVSGRAVSPLLATVLLLAITVAGGALVYSVFFSQAGSAVGSLDIQLVEAVMHKVGDIVTVSVTVKNSGTAEVAGILVEGVDDNGRRFTLALPPARQGQASGVTIRIPLNQPNLALDGSGNDNHGAANNISWVNTDRGLRARFNGSNSYVWVSYSPVFTGLQQISLRAWINFSTDPAGTLQEVAQKWTGWTFGYNSDGWWFELYSTDGRYIAWFNDEWDADANVWYQVTSNYDGDVARTYIGPSILAEHPEALDGKTIQNDGNDVLGIGAAGWDGPYISGRYFNGIIEGVAIYSTALSQKEIEIMAENPGFLVTRSLVFYMPLNEGSNSPYSFTTGKSYPLTIKALAYNGDTLIQTATLTCY